MNSKIELVSDPCQPNLLNMPIVVMEVVLKHLNCPSIFRLQKVCRDLRFSIEKIKPDLRLEFVRLNLFNPKVRKPELTCSLRRNRRINDTRPEISMEDAEALLKYTNLILNELHINWNFAYLRGLGYIKRTRIGDIDKLIESLKSMLENRDRLLKTSRISLKVLQLPQAAEYLKFVDPKSLKDIHIKIGIEPLHDAIEMDFSQLESLEQWKNADVFAIKGNYILTASESFASFKTISIECRTVSMEKLNEVKELFVRSPKLKNFNIKSSQTFEMIEQLMSMLGQPDSFHEEPGAFLPMILELIGGRRVTDSEQRTWKWLKNIPGSTETLQITLRSGREDSINFSKV
ncbi:unnamed protein product [Caenorhabditis brenneri]